jgi:hypothetical protein
MGSHPVLDYRLDQRRRLGVLRYAHVARCHADGLITDRPGGNKCAVVQPADCWNHFCRPSGIFASIQPVFLRHRLTRRKAYDPQRWHQFLIYIGLTLLSFVINAGMNSLLPIIYNGAFMWSIGGFVIVSITVLACASPDFNSAYFVFCDFINQTGCEFLQ